MIANNDSSPENYATANISLPEEDESQQCASGTSKFRSLITSLITFSYSTLVFRQGKVTYLHISINMMIVSLNDGAH